MHEALGPPPRQYTARAIEDVCIDYLQLITTPAARWLQNSNENPKSYLDNDLLVSTLVPKQPPCLGADPNLPFCPDHRMRYEP